MTQQHPITPPPELVQQWCNKAYGSPGTISSEYVATRAAQWGFDQAKADIERERQEAADQELEACCEWNNDYRNGLGKQLRSARRPKPPSLKEQALQALNDAVKMADDTPPEGIRSDQADIIRRALESIPDPS